MLPIPGSLCGITYSVAARIYRGEFDLSPEARERLEDGLEQLRKVDNVVGDFSLTDLESWPGFADRLAEYGLREGRIDASTRQLREDFGLDRELDVSRWVLRLLDSVGVFREFEVDDDNLFELIQVGDAVVGRPDDSDGKLYVSADDTDCFWAGIRDIAWASKRSYPRDAPEPGYGTGGFPLYDTQYYGTECSLIDDWRAYLEDGIKHRVLIEGDLGQGKTTLWQHVVSELGARAVYLDGEDLDKSKDCLDVVRQLAPDIVVLEGLGGLSGFKNCSRRVQQWLKNCLGGTLCFVTTQSLRKVSQKLIQPGLLDHCIELGPRSHKTRRKIVDKLEQRYELKIPDSKYEEAQHVLRQTSPGYLDSVFEKTEVFGWEVLEDAEAKLSGTQSCSVPRRWLSQHNFKVVDLNIKSLFEHLERRLSLKTVFSAEEGKVRVGSLPNGARIAITRDISTSHFGNNEVEIYRHTVECTKETFFEGVAETFWADRKFVSLTFKDHTELKFVESDQGNIRYLGPLDRHLTSWQKFREEGLTRTILLQGRPGCGKSTFCRYAAEYLSERTIALSSEDFSSLSYGQWQSIEGLLQPDCVIIDDVDRIGSNSLDNRLQFLEEDRSSIPFVFFTTNDVGELPTAMKRPGRIDRIIEVEPPGRDERRKLIESFAKRVGVEVPSDRLEMLDSVLAEYSHAHLQEVLRRARIYGWDSDELLDDTTFDRIEYQSEPESAEIPF